MGHPLGMWFHSQLAPIQVVAVTNRVMLPSLPALAPALVPLCACQARDCSSWKLTLAKWLVFSTGSTLAQLAVWWGWRWPAEAAPGHALSPGTGHLLGVAADQEPCCVCDLSTSRIQWSCAERNPNRWLCKEIGSFCAAARCLGYWGCAAATAWPAVPKGWRELQALPISSFEGLGGSTVGLWAHGGVTMAKNILSPWRKAIFA